jgi:hypothetical protein
MPYLLEIIVPYFIRYWTDDDGIKSIYFGEVKNFSNAMNTSGVLHFNDHVNFLCKRLEIAHF